MDHRKLQAFAQENRQGSPAGAPASSRKIKNRAQGRSSDGQNFFMWLTSCHSMAVSRFVGKLGVLCLLAVPVSGTAYGQAVYTTNGIEFAIAGLLPGDQVHPQLALGATNGYIVWQDNRTDGLGLGISARRLNASLSGAFSTFRVNANGTNDQENPQVSLLKRGGAAFVWQGGRLGYQQIFARFMSASNTWATGDVRVSTNTSNAKLNPAIATLADGNVIVVWSSFNQRGSNTVQDVYGQRLSPAGQKLGPEFAINQFSSYSQRTPVVTPTNAMRENAQASFQRRTSDGRCMDRESSLSRTEARNSVQSGSGMSSSMAAISDRIRLRNSSDLRFSNMFCQLP